MRASLFAGDGSDDVFSRIEVRLDVLTDDWVCGTIWTKSKTFADVKTPFAARVVTPP